MKSQSSFDQPKGNKPTVVAKSALLGFSFLLCFLDALQQFVRQVLFLHLLFTNSQKQKKEDNSY